MFSLRLSSTCYYIHTYFCHDKSSYFNLVIFTAPRQPQFMHRTLTPLSLTYLTEFATNCMKCESRQPYCLMLFYLTNFPLSAMVQSPSFHYLRRTIRKLLLHHASTLLVLPPLLLTGEMHSKNFHLLRNLEKICWQCA